MISCEASTSPLLLGANTELLALWSKFLRAMTSYSNLRGDATKQLLTLIKPFLHIAPVSAHAFISPGACHLVFTKAKVGYQPPEGTTTDWTSRVHCERIMFLGAHNGMKGGINTIPSLWTPRPLPWRCGSVEDLQTSFSECFRLRKTIRQLKSHKDDLTIELWNAQQDAKRLVTEASELRRTLRQLREAEHRLIPISHEMTRVEEELESVGELSEEWCPKVTLHMNKDSRYRSHPVFAPSFMVRAMVQDLHLLSRDAEELTLENDKLEKDMRVRASRNKSEIASLEQEVDDLKTAMDSQRAALQKETDVHKKQLQEERDKNKSPRSSREAVTTSSSSRSVPNNQPDRQPRRKTVPPSSGSQVMVGHDDDLMSILSGASDKKVHGLRPRSSHERLPYSR